jgi:phospholipid/cholesterol/gamma-HCH transport system ATP-binding protein
MPAPASAPTTDQNTPDANAPIVAFKDVSIKFDSDKPLLNKISFGVTRGQTLIILGPAGCGKSVLMKLVDGLMR